MARKSSKENIVKEAFRFSQNVGLLTCETSTPDQLLPSHASMVHGESGNFPMEIFSSAGVCLTSLQALKIGYSHILSGLHSSAICSASERTIRTNNIKREQKILLLVLESGRFSFGTALLSN